jgi:hypothetical protein
MSKLYLIDESAGILDEVQARLLAKADNEGWVYTLVLRQLVNRLYRDRDYQAKRVKQGRHTAYDYALDRDQKALAWAIRALVQCVPPDEKAKPEPPKKPRKPARRLSPAQRTVYTWIAGCVRRPPSLGNQRQSRRGGTHPRCTTGRPARTRWPSRGRRGRGHPRDGAPRGAAPSPGAPAGGRAGRRVQDAPTGAGSRPARWLRCPDSP